MQHVVDNTCNCLRMYISSSIGTIDYVFPNNSYTTMEFIDKLTELLSKPTDNFSGFNVTLEGNYVSITPKDTTYYFAPMNDIPNSIDKCSFFRNILFVNKNNINTTDSNKLCIYKQMRFAYPEFNAIPVKQKTTGNEILYRNSEGKVGHVNYSLHIIGNILVSDFLALANSKHSGILEITSLTDDTYINTSELIKLDFSSNKAVFFSSFWGLFFGFWYSDYYCDTAQQFTPEKQNSQCTRLSNNFWPSSGPMYNTYRIATEKVIYMARIDNTPVVKVNGIDFSVNGLVSLNLPVSILSQLQNKISNFSTTELTNEYLESLEYDYIKLPFNSMYFSSEIIENKLKIIPKNIYNCFNSDCKCYSENNKCKCEERTCYTENFINKKTEVSKLFSVAFFILLLISMKL